MSDTFERAYTRLEKKFKAQVKSDRKSLKCRDIVFLPQSVRPTENVDYVFVVMEPALHRWAKTGPEGEEKVKRGFRDFAFSVEDFILHHCIREYLCHNQGSTYYLTNLSKGAMSAGKAEINRVERWERWLPLLREELELVRKETTKLIAVGRGVRDFLESNDFCDVRMILHYSQQAARYREKWIEWDEKALDRFKRQVSSGDIIATAKSVTSQAGMKWDLTSPGLRGLEGRDLSDSQKMLMFGYKCYFERRLL